jgi:hypothetical protein
MSYPMILRKQASGTMNIGILEQKEKNQRLVSNLAMYSFESIDFTA